MTPGAALSASRSCRMPLDSSCSGSRLVTLDVTVEASRGTRRAETMSGSSSVFSRLGVSAKADGTGSRHKPARADRSKLRRMAVGIIFSLLCLRCLRTKRGPRGKNFLRPSLVDPLSRRTTESARRVSDGRLTSYMGTSIRAPGFMPHPRLHRPCGRLTWWGLVSGYRSATAPGSHRIPCRPCG